MSPIPLLAILASTGAGAQEAADDPHLWLEEVEAEAALDWVRAQNAISEADLSADPAFEAMRARLLSVFDSNERIPYVHKRGEHYYNFWVDAEHPQGLWRRTSLESWKAAETEWEVLLDLDALSATEGEKWVWHGSDCLRPAYDRCLLSLSRGGADADVTREYDVPSRSFVQGGFELPEAKGGAGWIDLDTVYVQTDFGPGSMTDSGYPRVAKRWRRGTPLEQAELVFEGVAEDISVGAYHDHTPGFERSIAYRGTTFYSNRLFLIGKKGLVEIEKPESANASAHRDWLTLELRDDWEVDGKVYKAGSLLAAPFGKWMKGKREIELLFEPSETTSLAGYDWTQNYLILNVMDNVRNKLEVLRPGKGGWSRSPLPGVPEFGAVSASAVDSEESDAYWLHITDYLTPSSVGMGVVGAGPAKILKSLPSFFETEGLEVSQHFTPSKDGTSIPYFQVSKKDLPTDGTAPTLLYGYGGFEVPMVPGYSASVGSAWLEQGGVYVVANIRGGGEFGPRWHKAALRENRHRAYEDFVAVARDLVGRGVTSKERLGALGGSNGGLLMGNMYTLYPDDFGAIVCKVPLLDMKRYTKLLAGASWASEYGDPDVPEDWAFIQGFSPYHNYSVDDAHPPMLIMTSTRDDRVHPGHARKMAAKLLDSGKDVLYYENIEGGHGGAANNEQSAFMNTMAFRFLWSRLSPAEEAPVEDAKE